MCLGVPGRVVRVRRQHRASSISSASAATCGSSWSISRSRPGDYILNHVGYAIRRIPEEDIEGTLAMYEQLLREADATI